MGCLLLILLVGLYPLLQTCLLILWIFISVCEHYLATYTAETLKLCCSLTRNLTSSTKTATGPPLITRYQSPIVAAHE